MKPAEQLGARAVQLGFVTDEQVARALERQRERKARGEPHVPLGLLMVEAGSLTSGQLAALIGKNGAVDVPLDEDAVRLAARLHASLGGEHRLIMIAGTREHDGAARVAAELATALALMDEGSVLLIDANLRSPGLNAHFAVRPAPGLAEVVDGSVTLAAAAVPTGVPGLSILPSGRTDLDPSRIFLSEGSTQLLREVRAKYRLTILAAAPVLSAPESAALAARSDGVVAVAAESRTQRSDVLETQRMLDGLKANFLGLVLTRAVKKRAKSRGDAS
jgi:Mrp family chromosome partitioning ATPase